jgi:hypothetical protein
VKVVAFKFTNGDHIENRISKANELLAHSQSDFIVINDLSDRLNGVQKSFTIISKDGKSINAETNKDLAKELEKLLAVTIGRER